jgi:predicted ATPase
VGAYRPEDVALGRDGTRHPLDPVVNEFKRLFGDIIVSVDQAQRRDFTEALLDSEPNRLGAAFREMLFQQTRGHPLFTIELLREMQERNELVQDDDGRWVEGASLAWEAMPARVEAVIAERISRLPDPLQAVLRTASVEGETFTAEVVARVRATDERELLEKLSSDLDRRHRLLRGQSIQRINGQLLSRYRFRHILIQKYLYSSLNEVERINLHNQVGRTLEELYDQRGKKAEIAPQLARHFQEARIMEKAIQYLHQAGNKAVSLSAYREGINQLTKALELLETLPPSPARDEQELDLQLSLGMAWMGDIPSPEWGNTYTRARELCQQIEKIPQLCHVLGHLAIYHYVRAEYQQARAIAEEALTLAQKSQDPILEILEHWHLGFILFGVGDFISAHTHLQKVISFYEPKKHHPQFLRLWGSDPGVSAQAYDACCLWCLGYPDQAAQVGQRATALADEFDHAFTLADVEAFAGCLLNEMRRDAPALKISAEKLIHLSQVIGFLTWFGTGTCYVGEALVIDGQFGEGIAWIQRGKSFRLARGARCYLSGTLGLLAEAQKEANSLAEGLIAISEALAFVEETGERHQEAELVRLQGTFLQAQGKRDEAEASLRQAIETARNQQAKSWELRAAISLARLWQAQGKLDEAKQLLAPIYGWFTEGFDTPDLNAAREILQT